MTSSGPYTQSYDLSHMYNIPDIRGSLPKKIECCKSVAGVISRHPELKKFNEIIKKSGLQDRLNSPQANFTLFVTTDNDMGDLDVSKMDRATSIHFIKSSMLEGKITTDCMMSTSVGLYYTEYPPNRLYILTEEDCSLVVNNRKIIHRDIECSNGLLHIVDGLVWKMEI